VGKCATPPAIDGVLDDTGWPSASGFTGMSNIFHQRLSDLPTTVRLCYDSDALYIAYDCTLPEGAAPVGSVGDRDTGSPWHEDSAEIFLAPGPARPEDHYQLVTNSSGLIFDLHSGQKSWNGDWSVATAATEGHYYVEVAIPFASLGAATPQPGERWRANFCRDVATPAKAYESWADVGQTYKAPELFGWLQFAGDGLTAAVTDLGHPDFGRVDVAATLSNPGAEAATVQLEARLLMPGTTLTERGEEWGVTVQGKMVSERREVTVPAGGTETVRLQRDFLDADLRLLQLTALVGDTELYRHELPVHLEPPVALSIEDVPSRQNLRLLVFTGGLRDVNRAEAVASVTALSAAGAQMGETVALPLPEIEAMAWLDYADWPAGEYIISVAVAEGGPVLQEASVAFTRAERPAWFGNDIGTARVVIPPFTPMRYPDVRSLECWGRRMSFADGMLPSVMTSSAEELLAGPMEIVLDGVAVRAAAGPVFAEKADDRAEFTVTGQAGGATFRADCWQEYDGFTWVTLTCPEPPGGEVQSLTLEIPLAPEHAQMIHGTTNQRRGGINEFIGDEPLRYPFVPMMWVGSNDRGLCWFAESEQGWAPLDASDAIEIVPSDDAVTLRCRIIAEPTRLAEDWSVSFGLIATPVKPLPQGWTTLNYGVLPASRRTIQWEPLGLKQDLGTIWNNSFAEHLTDPFHPKPELARVVAEARELGVSPFAYIAPNVHTMQYPEPARYLPEWRVDPVHEFYEWPGETYTVLCARSSWQDYLLAGYRYLVDGFDLDGIYHDGGGPSLCQNELHGCGWQDATGERHRVRNIRACRQFHKRTATMLAHDLGIENYVVFEHTSDVTWLPTQTFLTHHFDGEQYKGQKRAKVPYTEILSLQEIRPEYVSTQWGIPQVFLNIGDRATEEGRLDSETFLAYLLPHGIPFYPRYCHEATAIGIYSMWRDFGAREAEFIPYWRGLPGLTSQADPEQVQVSIYRAEGRVLVVAGNVSDQPLQVAMTVDRAVAGVPADATVRQTFPERKAALVGDTLSVQIPAHSFALVWVQ